MIDEQEETYVNITNEYIEVTSRFFEEDCFEYVQYKVYDITNNVYQLRDEITADVVNEIEVVFIRTSQGLEITVKEGRNSIQIYIHKVMCRTPKICSASTSK